jgi:hypothetical protein
MLIPGDEIASAQLSQSAFQRAFARSQPVRQRLQRQWFLGVLELAIGCPRSHPAL